MSSTPTPPKPFFLTLNDGNQIPWLAFGSGTVHRSKDVSNLIRASITRGFTHIDTAQGTRTAGDPGCNIHVHNKLVLDTSKDKRLRRPGLCQPSILLIHNHDASAPLRLCK